MGHYDTNNASLEGVRAMRPAFAKLADMERKRHTRKETSLNPSPSQIFFYEREFYVLSNFSAFRVNWQKRDFDTSEAAYQWSKFSPCGSNPIGDLIIKARSAHDAFQIARAHQHLVREDWLEVRVWLMKQILIAKLEQHEYVERKLMETGDSELVEDSWRDSFWGWGADRNGLNMLGKLWMEIRRDIKDKL